jgi:hypothetical protein
MASLSLIVSVFRRLCGVPSPCPQALHVAAGDGLVDICRTLLAAGANANAATTACSGLRIASKQTPFHRAAAAAAMGKPNGPATLALIAGNGACFPGVLAGFPSGPCELLVDAARFYCRRRSGGAGQRWGHAVRCVRSTLESAVEPDHRTIGAIRLCNVRYEQ